MFKRLLILVVLSLLAVGAQAQEDDRVYRWYIVDLVQVIRGETVYNFPEHFGGRFLTPDPELAGVAERHLMAFGNAPVTLVYADTTAAENTYLQSLAGPANNYDVIVIGADIDTRTVTSANRDDIRNALESKNIPGLWVNVGDTYRRVLREIAGFFQYNQRFAGLANTDPFSEGVALSTTIGTVAANNWQTFAGFFDAAKAQPMTTDADAWQYAESQALANGASRVNILKMTLMLTARLEGYPVPGNIQANTTLYQIFTALSAFYGERQYSVGPFIL
jgi:hypothetical protein